jgi:HEAT repeat protein
MMRLLEDEDTSLVVRIGLSAIIESLAGSDLLRQYESAFIKLARTTSDRIGEDALYYLSLLGTKDSLQALADIANDEKHSLRAQAAEILQDLSGDQDVH